MMDRKHLLCSCGLLLTLIQDAICKHGTSVVSSPCRKHKEPKPAHKYIEAFLQFKFLRSLKYQQLGSNIVTTKYFGKAVSHTFIWIAHETFNSSDCFTMKEPEWILYIPRLCLVDMNYNPVPLEINILKPNGWLILHRSTQIDGMQYFPYYRHRNLEMGWFVNLDHKVFTKIILMELFMPSANLPHCSLSELKVEHNKSESFSFCGSYSSVSLYPPYHSFKIVATFYSSAKFHIEGFLTLVYGSICSVPLQVNLSVSKLNATFLYLHCKTHIHFTITVHKLFCVHIRTTNRPKDTNMMIYDGPGTMSTKIAKIPPVVCSTFQCVVHVNILQSISLVSLLVNYSEQNSTHPTTRYILNTSISLELPSQNEKGSIFALELQATCGQHVHLIFQRMNFYSKDQVSCEFGGLAIYDDDSPDSRETILLCESQLSYLPSRRNLFSETSRIIILVFWYQFYSEISVQLKAQSSPCLGVFVDPCQSPEAKVGIIMDSHYNTIEHEHKMYYGFTRTGQKLLRKRFIITSNFACLVVQLRKSHKDIDGYCFVTVEHWPKRTSHVSVLYNLTFFVPRNPINREEVHLEGEFQKVDDWLPSTKPYRKHAKCKWRIRWNSAFTTHSTHGGIKYHTISPQHLEGGLEMESFSLTSLNNLLSLRVLSIPGWSFSWVTLKITERQQNTASRTTVCTIICARWCEYPKEAQASTVSGLAPTDTLFFNGDITSETSSTFLPFLWIVMSMFRQSREFGFVDSLGAGFYVNLNSLDYGFEVSLPGRLFSTVICSSRLAIKAYKIHSRDSQFQYLADASDKNCSNLNTLKPAMNHITHCISYQTSMFYQFLSNFIFFEDQLSWTDANQKCTQLGGHLPIFVSSEEMAEFLALIKMSTKLLYLRGIHIALSVGATGKVGKLANYPKPFAIYSKQQQQQCDKQLYFLKIILVLRHFAFHTALVKLS